MKKIYLFLFIFSLVTGALFSQARQQLELVQELVAARQFDEAFFQVNQLITEHPNTFESFEARILLAELQFQMNLYQEARMQLMILLRNPFQLTVNQRVKTYHNLGMIFYHEANYEQAIESFERLFLDYRNTPEAAAALPFYFDSFFQLNEYQSVIVRTRDMLRQFTGDEVQAELLYQQAYAYYVGNMLPQANQNIDDINNRFSHTMAAWKAAELQIRIYARERGRQSAIIMLENRLNEPMSRQLEERLAWLLAQYYLEDGQRSRARDTINFILNKFNLSDNLSTYHLAWLKIMVEDRDIRPIFEREDFILRTSRGKAEYLEIIYYLANAYTLAQDFWRARNMLDEHLELLINSQSTPGRAADELLFNYRQLYADIFILQGQFVNGIELYNTILSSFGHLGRNFEILMKLGDIYLFQYNQEGQALNFYRQAVTLARNVDQTAEALQMAALCLESLGQYSDALSTLSQIPLDSITNQRQREEISNKITLLQIFFHADTQSALANYMRRNILLQSSPATANSSLSMIDYTTILAIELKQFEDALELLHSGNNYEMRMERIKLYLLYAYRNVLEGDTQEAAQYTRLVDTESQQLGRNINQDDRLMINCFQDFISNRGRINANNVQATHSFVETSPVNRNSIDFRNFFRYQLWKHYQEVGNVNAMTQIAQTINQDAFVGNLEYQLVQVMLASYYFQNDMFTNAIETFAKAERFLNLAHPEYFYQYAMSLYHSRAGRDRAIDILQRLVLNNIENANIASAKELILTQWISTNRLQDALDILNQIPPLSRTDEDYRHFALIYNRQGRHQQEKDALLHIQNKTMIETQRIATLHFLTGDRVMAEYTWQEILNNSTQLEHRLNAHASFGNMYYLSENYNEAIRQYEEFFRLYNASVLASELVITPDIVAKEMIISLYMIDNRPRAETMLRDLAPHINRNPAILAEIRLYEGIYYSRRDRARATRPLTQVIDDINAPSEVAFKAMYYRAVVAMQENRFDNAERDLVAALNTEDIQLRNQIMLSLGNLYHNQENHEDALELYYEVILNDSDGTLARDAAHNFAIAAKHLSAWEMAIAAYKIIMDRWGQTALNPQTRLTIGFSFYQAREYDQALLLLNQLMPDLNTNELRAEGQYWIAESHAAKGDFDTAIADFQRLRSSYPNERRWTGLSELRIAEIYYEQGNIDTAMDMFREIVRVHGAASDLGREANRYLN